MTQEPTTHAFNKALQIAIDEIAGWESLLELSYTTLSRDNNFSNPREAAREHGNTMRLLAAIREKIEDRKVKVHEQA